MKRYYKQKSTIYAALYQGILSGVPIMLMVRDQHEIDSIRSSIWNKLGAGKCATKTIKKEKLTFLRILPE